LTQEGMGDADRMGAQEKTVTREKLGYLGKDYVTQERTGDALKGENTMTWGPCSQHSIFFITNV
jgi:hypothetical protein